jgi:arsenate reductase
MTLTVYHLKTCDTCRKAIKALQAAGENLTLIDVRADRIPPRDMEHLIDSVGYETLLNTRSTTWRGLSDADKSDMDQAKALTLMTEHPTLIKRPVIIREDRVSVGWTQDVQAQYLPRN